MAKKIGDSGAKPNVVARMKGFLHDVSAELKKVAWPSREELKSSTTIVMMMLVVFAGLIYVYDVVFQAMILALLKLG